MNRVVVIITIVLAFISHLVIASMMKQSRTSLFSVQLLRYARDGKSDTNKWPKTFGFGHAATKAEINAWDIDIRPDGKGLPPGQGSVSKGRAIYVQKCAACHGEKSAGQLEVKTLGPALIGDTILKGKGKTIGNYWPYATTLFDYIRRAMPYPQAGSLSNAEVYSLTAYLLNANHVVVDTIQTAKTLPKVAMPAKKLFVFDNRKGGPEVK